MSSDCLSSRVENEGFSNATTLALCVSVHRHSRASFFFRKECLKKKKFVLQKKMVIDEVAPEHGVVLRRSARARSGYVNVHFDNRGCAKPWSVKTTNYRSAGFATAREAAIHLALHVAQHVRDGVAKKMAPRSCVGKPAARKPVAPMAPKKATVAPKKAAVAPTVAPKKATVAPTVAPKKATVAKDKQANQQAAPAAWMQKPGVKFSGGACDLFGQRIRMSRTRRELPSLAVVKEWMPCADAGFGIVFDENPGVVLYEDLLRRGRSDWTIVEWEGDEWETMKLRPMCPQCGHPLGIGRDAWTMCSACKYPEPGAASTSMLSRLCTNDPNRRNRPVYREVDSDDE